MSLYRGKSTNEIELIAGALEGSGSQSNPSTGAPVGSLMIWLGLRTNIPRGYGIPEGQLVSRSEYAALFNKYGTLYGAGDGSTTFGLPDLRGRVIVHPDGSPEFLSEGQKGGVKTQALTVAQLPSHNHGQDAHSHYTWIENQGYQTGQQGVVHQSTYGWRDGLNVWSSSSTPTIHATGSGSAHNNIQPYMVGFYILKMIEDPHTEDVYNLDLAVKTLQTKVNNIYPVGAIYMSVNSANPGTTLGGTWIAWGTGRVPVGVDTGQSVFNTVEKPGGHRYLQAHTHGGSTSSVGDHNHTMLFGAATTQGLGSNVGLGTGSYGYDTANMTGAGGHNHSFTTATTGSGDGENLQPYITCYMWKRTL